MWISIFFLGGLGVLLRFVISSQLNTHSLVGGFPLGTFLVNIIGSFFIGWLIGQNHFQISESLKVALIVGFLGGLTTFSSYSLELVQFLRAERYQLAFLYFFLTQVISVLFCILGLKLSKIL